LLTSKKALKSAEKWQVKCENTDGGQTMTVNQRRRRSLKMMMQLMDD
jgi:hypothetical protein